MSQSIRRPLQNKEEEEEEGEWTMLDISEKQLTSLSPNIAIYTNHLTKLNLQKNNFTKLPVELFKLTKLKHLDLSYNKIPVLQPEIANLLQLKELNLAYNFLRELPNDLGKLFRLEKLGLEGNHITKPDPSVLSEGAVEIVKFLRDRIEGEQPPPPREWATMNNKSAVNLQSEGFRVLCYNILAESYTQPDRMNNCPKWALKWEYRKGMIMKEIFSYDPDIICLQEVETEQQEIFFQPEFKKRGYEGKFFPKTRARTMDELSRKTVDGCSTFWKKDLFTLISEELIEYQSMALARHESIGQAGINRMMMKDNIALGVLLKPNKGSPLTISNNTENDQLLVVNTHIHWDPHYPDIKLMQVQMLLEKLEDISKRSRGRAAMARTLPIVICGDFNSGTNSAVYKLLSGKSISGDHADFCNQDYGIYTKKGLSHSLSFKSTYCSVMGSEPHFTNYTVDFVGTLDYIWYTDDTLATERVLVPLKEEIILSQNGALPNPYLCSDHIALCADIYGRTVPLSLSPSSLQAGQLL